MASIAVDPDEMRRTARGMRDACTEARRLQRAAGEAGPVVTGSAELADALARHAQTWSWTIEKVEDRIREVADLLATAGEVYGVVEECLADLTGRSPGVQRGE